MTSRWPSNVTPFSAGTAERSRPDAHKQVPRPAPGRPSSMSRFLAKVDFGSSPRGCWLWTASAHSWGHGQFQTGTTMALAHRWFYSQVVGPVPADLDLDHLCRNPRCVNPDHLEPVTRRVNTLRGNGPTAVNARKTHCHRGHEFASDNLYIRPNGKRECRACARVRDRVRRSAA